MSQAVSSVASNGTEAMTLSRDLLIVNKRGLHARASAKFVQTVEGYDAEIHVSKDGMTVGGTSITGPDDAGRQHRLLGFRHLQRPPGARGARCPRRSGCRQVRRRNLTLAGQET